jgi:hypothetical protein
MQRSIDALKVALRVLTAISEHHEPDLADVDRLRAYAPLLSDASLDELACDVIQQALRRRNEARKALGFGS